MARVDVRRGRLASGLGEEQCETGDVSGIRGIGDPAGRRARLVPLLVLAAATVADRSVGPERVGARRAFVIFGYMFVPVGLAMHLAHNLSHLLLEGAGIVLAAQRALALYTPLSIGQAEWPAPALASASVVSLLQMAILVGFFVLSLIAGHRLALRFYGSPRAAGRALTPMAVMSLLLTVVGIVLLNQPMGMRHGP